MLSPQRVSAITSLPRPVTKKQLMSFLGLVGYCRHFIINYSQLEWPLREICHAPGLVPSGAVSWSPEGDEAFVALKKALQSAPCLGTADTTLPFYQHVDERSGCMTSELSQMHGDKMRPVAFFSAKLDAVAAGLPKCLCAVAAAEIAILASRDIVGYSDLTLFVPHAVDQILNEQKTSHLSASCYTRNIACLLESPNVKVHHCSALNPATLVPLSDEGLPHDCVAQLELSCNPCPDLSDKPLSLPEAHLFVDCSARRDMGTGENKVGFAVVNENADVICSSSLPSHLSAQAAELIALTEACRWAENKKVNIYTDSRYAFGVVHDFGALWKHRKFLKNLIFTNLES
ncbi:uncharacterized protein LOC106523698 [Austrofundulus limnaeus]|uniref:Uncharacterized protein LOC106523698 n=1 Tax=Austrofundulus limnaeus TaxID=52670 RepID=A0A2I4BY46_AUSLI|nr:PREDICTED: uncharacterized protein LOC106523698 [Austrofundulus limnaeus]